MVHREAEGYGFVLSDGWAVQSVTRYPLNIWRQEVTGADVPTLEAVPFKWFRWVSSTLLHHDHVITSVPYLENPTQRM